MSRKDIFTVVAVAILGTVAAAVIVNLVLGDVNEKSVTFKSINVIEKTVGTPDEEVFNPDAINPTVEVYVGGCVDTNGNGVLDEDERASCQRLSTDNEDDENGEQ